MFTLNSDIGELQDHISAPDQGVDQATNMWLDFDEDLVLHDKGPAVVSLSVIIEDNLQKLTSPMADDLDTTDLPSDSTISAPTIPTLAEALTQLDHNQPTHA